MTRSPGACAIDDEGDSLHNGNPPGDTRRRPIARRLTLSAHSYSALIELAIGIAPPAERLRCQSLLAREI